MIKHVTSKHLEMLTLYKNLKTTSNLTHDVQQYCKKIKKTNRNLHRWLLQQCSILQKINLAQKAFHENWTLYNPKSYWPLSSNRKYMIYKVNPLTMWFCANRWLLNEVIPNMVKSMEHHFFMPLLKLLHSLPVFISRCHKVSFILLLSFSNASLKNGNHVI